MRGWIRRLCYDSRMTDILPLIVYAYMSWYDPALCNDQPINCFNPDSWWRMAAGHDAREYYGLALACPQEFPLGTRFVINGSRWGLADGEYICLDRGGSVVTRSDGSIVLDLLRSTPVWGETLPVVVIRPDDAPPLPLAVYAPLLSSVITVDDSQRNERIR